MLNRIIVTQNTQNYGKREATRINATSYRFLRILRVLRENKEKTITLPRINPIYYNIMGNRAIQFHKALSAALFVLLLSVAGMTKMYAYDFSAVCETGQTLYYNITDAQNHEVELTCPSANHFYYSWYGFAEPTGDIILPETVQYEGNTFTVTSIGESAFYECEGLAGVLTLPNTVVSIGDYAFYGCKNFTGNLVIPEGVKKIPQYAFAKCSGFSGLVIPATVISIRSHAFYGCSHLTQVSISGNRLTMIGVGAFAKCRRWTGNLVLPNSVTKIQDGAFSECSRLTGVTLSSSLTSIGNSAFYECSGLTEIAIPHAVTSIGDCAFMGCSGLTSINIPNSVTSIGFVANYGCRVFADCPSLEQITVEPGNPVYDSRDNCNAIIETQTNRLLIGCMNSVIPSTVTTIGGHAFYGSGLTTITIPNSVASIEEQAFRFCTSLTSITLPTSVTSIGSTVLGNCSALTSVEIQCSLTTIPSYMFLSCESLATIEIPESVTKIEMYAFSNCTGLTSIEIPSAMTAIQMHAFNNCSGLTSITVWADNPPALSPNTIYNPEVFDNVDKSIPVNVPCGSIPAYQNAEGWNAFTNYMEMCPYHWTPVAPGQYSSSTIIEGVILINGVEQYNDQLELGVFCGDECRGSQRASYFPPTGRYIVQIMVFGEDNDVLSFRLYDHQQQQEIPLTPPANVVFNDDGYGTLLEPYVLNFASPIVHTQTLNTGWNWYSTYIEQSGIDGLRQLENSIGIPNALIQSQNDGYVKSGLRNGRVVWRGELSSINNEEMVKIATMEACEATMVGQATYPSNHPITINRGWNWIGFPCSERVSVSEALSGFTPQNGDVIKSINSITTYYSDGDYNMWYGTLNIFEPGQGYMYGSKSDASKTLVYQTDNRSEATLANITPENNYYQPVDNYADNMTLTAVIELDGNELRSEDYELAAFVGDECRGSVKLMYVESIDRYVAFLTVFGELEEELSFRLTDGIASGLSTDLLAYAIDDIVGDLDDPVVLHFGPIDVEENISANVRVYPNPSEGLFNIEGQNIRKVEVFNALGQPVYTKKTENELMTIDLTGHAAGIYLIRIVTDSGIWSHQVVKK